MIWAREFETLPRERLRELQLERLRTTVGRALEHVAPLKARLQKAGVRSPQDITSLDDLPRLPFTHKTDLREHYPFGLFAVPLDQVLRIHGSSGTRGKPTLVGYTRRDLDMWSEVMARALVAGGVEPGWVVHNAYGYGLVTGGLGFHQGAETMGCTVIPMSSGFTQRQVMMLQDLGGQVLCCTPSYALNIAQVLREMGVAPDSLNLRVGFFGAEPWTDRMRDQVERELGVAALNIYGLSEIVGPGVSIECLEGRNGLHIQEDHFLAEVVDLESGQPVPPGTLGELVFTPITKEALPLIRYRTGDLASLDVEPCVCGRTTARMSRVLGRHDDMLIIRGVNLYPSEVERILLGVPGIAPHYQLVVERPEAMDELSVLCEPAESSTEPDGVRMLAEHALFQQTGIHISVLVEEQGSVPRSEGKAVRVVDRRPKD